MYRMSSLLLPAGRVATSASSTANSSPLLSPPLSLQPQFQQQQQVQSRPKSPSLLHLVHFKALHKAATVTASKAGLELQVQMALFQPGNHKFLILHAARLSQAMQAMHPVQKPKTVQPRSPTSPSKLNGNNITRAYVPPHLRQPQPASAVHATLAPIAPAPVVAAPVARPWPTSRLQRKNNSNSKGDSSLLNLLKRRTALSDKGTVTEVENSPIVLKDAQGNIVKKIRRGPTLHFS